MGRNCCWMMEPGLKNSTLKKKKKETVTPLTPTVISPMDAHSTN